jgi:hypothetical protein
MLGFGTNIIGPNLDPSRDAGKEDYGQNKN